MTPEQISQAIRIALAHMAAHGIPVPMRADIIMHVARIIHQLDVRATPKRVANQLVECARMDYVSTSARKREKIDRKWRSVRIPISDFVSRDDHAIWTGVEEA